jgi:hypothetical protein
MKRITALLTILALVAAALTAAEKAGKARSID